MNKGYVSYSYKKLMFRFMLIMYIVVWFSSSIQYVGAQKIGYGNTFFETIYKANEVALVIGHVVFLVALVYGWRFASNYIENYEIFRSDLSAKAGIISLVIGIYNLYIPYGLGGGLFKILKEPGFANYSVILWQFCTLIVFANLMLKAHSEAIDDEMSVSENKGIFYVDGQSGNGAYDYYLKEIGEDK